MTFYCLVKDRDGTSEFDVPFQEFRFTDELNKGKTATFKFERTSLKNTADAYDVEIEDMFSGAYREIEVYDEDDNKIFAGYVAEVMMSAGHNDEGGLTVTAKGFFNLLEKRYTDNLEEYDATDASDIAWGLINTTQNNGSYGDLGITRGATGKPTKDRDRTYRFKEVALAIKKLSSDEVKDGFDFDIDVDKKFNVYYPEKGTQRPNIILEEGFNINTYNIYKTFIDGMVNQVYVLGEGQGDNILYVQRDADNAYKNAYFLLQDVLSEKDIITTDTLNDKGDIHLEKYREPRYTISLTTDYEEPVFTDYDLGDELKIKIPSYDIDEYYRVVKRICNHDGVVNLSLSEI